MNTQYVGRLDVAPRAHPGDGLVDVVQVDAAMTARERWQAWRRLPLGTHLPHERISVRRVAEIELAVADRVGVAIDGCPVGTGRDIRVTIEPDALTVYV
jgi:diacylglycerol kinase family enzyme